MVAWVVKAIIPYIRHSYTLRTGGFYPHAINSPSLLKAYVCRYDRIEQQREQVAQRRAELGMILKSQVRDPNTKAGERRTAAGLMASAISKAWAHQQLLDAHSAQLRHQQEALSRPQNAGTVHPYHQDKQMEQLWP